MKVDRSTFKANADKWTVCYKLSTNCDATLYFR